MDLLDQGIKKLGFGLMRLPKIGDEIDIEQTKTMVDMFMEAGCTYFDTAWAYGGSEDAIRQALVERYPRESYTLATKLAAWINCDTREKAISQFETSLKQTGAGYFDFYLLHNLGDYKTHFFDDYGIWDFVQEKKSQGLIKHIGFSFHAAPEELDEILTKHPETEFVQLQINYGDWENPDVQSRRCYEIARKHNKPIVIMEPVKGGMLATPPSSVEKIFKDADPNASCASWAVKFAADLEGVLTVLSGMSNIEQMQDNLSYMRDFIGLSSQERTVLSNAREAFARVPLVPCTTCNYCAKVCPNNIGISGSFTAMNYVTLYNNIPAAKHQLGFKVEKIGKKPVSECLKCGACEDVCPQHIHIRDMLDKVSETFEV